MNWRNCVSRLVKKPLAYLLVYVALIPAYAFVYSSLEGHFYQATWRLDQTFRNHEAAVVSELIELVTTLVRNHQSSDYKVTSEDFTTGPDGLQLGPHDVRFHVDWTVDVAGANGYVYSLAQSDWIIVAPPTEVGVDYADSQKLFEMPFSATISRRFARQLPPNREGQFTKWDEHFEGYVINTADGPARLTGSVKLTRDLFLDILRLRWVNDGHTIAARGSFWRFIYFSAITQTTVGYGDIVPLTDLARGCVASQAVLGVIVIGFFLNAVAVRLASKEDAAN